jgi:hypothetical protein
MEERERKETKKRSGSTEHAFRFIIMIMLSSPFNETRRRERDKRPKRIYVYKARRHVF